MAETTKPDIYTVKVYRYLPEDGNKPYMEEHKIDAAKYGYKKVQHLLMHIQNHIDSTFAMRYSCAMSDCGSCAMNINGKNGLACITDLVDYPSKVITIRPIPGMPVIRDLAVDMTQFYQQYEKAMPFLQNDEPAPAKERLQSVEDRESLDGLYECILCACCSSSCPSYWWNPDKFLGPAALLHAARFLVDSRDTATEKRLASLSDAYSAMRCRSIMNCVDACPKGLNPTKAIGEIRTELLNEK